MKEIVEAMRIALGENAKVWVREVRIYNGSLISSAEGWFGDDVLWDSVKSHNNTMREQRFRNGKSSFKLCWMLNEENSND